MENAKKPTEVWLMNGVLEKIKKEKMIIIYFVSLLILMLVITGCAGGLDEPSAKNTALPSESSIEETRTVSPTIPETVPKSTPRPPRKLWTR